MDNDTSFLNKKYSAEDLKVNDTQVEKLREYFNSKHPTDFPNEMEVIRHNRDEDYGWSLVFLEKTGKAYGCIYKYSDDRLTGYIDEISVESKYRKQGLGNRMLKLLENELKNSGVCFVHLLVENDSWMHDWYKRYGYVDFKEHEKEKTYHWMRKVLTINSI